MKLHLFSSGAIITWKHLLIRGYPERVRFSVPVPFYLLEHRSGLFLFDTGQQIPGTPPPDDADFIPVATDRDRAVRQLAARGISPGSLAGIILSHRHSDHADGLADFPGVPCFIRHEEMPLPGHGDAEPRNWVFPEGDWDLTGDGRILLIPTPGHTAGHQSVLLTMDHGEKILLTADAAYTEAALEQTPPPEEAHHPYWNSIRRIRDYKASGVRVITGHDPDTWPGISQEFI